MIGIFFFAFGLALAWHGFEVGGLTGFLDLMGAAVLWLFGFAASAMDNMPRRGHRPPPFPPGYKNSKRDRQ